MFKYKVNYFLGFIFLVSISSIVSAFYIENVLGHQPCKLCLIERIPYILSVIIIIMNYFFEKNEKLSLILLIIIFFISLIIAIYHFGIEQGFFIENSVCNLNSNTITQSKEELLKILQQRNISCKDVTFRIFGLSLTTINIVISLLFIITLTKIYTKYEKKK